MIGEKFQNLIKVIAVPVVLLLVIIVLVTVYNKIKKIQTSEPIYLRKPINAKKPLQIAADAVKLPVAGNEYSMMFWMYINDWSYRKGQWKHVLHKGDPKANRPQPSVWLTPNKNNLLIRYNTIENSGNYIANKRQMPKSFLNGDAVETNYTLVEKDGIMPTYKQIKNMASNMGQKDIIIVLKRLEILDDNTIPVWAAIKNSNLKDDKLVSQELTMTNFENRDVYTCLFKGGVSLSPMAENPLENDDGMSNLIENVPLNRWTHVAIVVNEYATHVYLDGYLTSSTALKTHVKNNTGDLFVTNFGGFGGMLTHLRYFDTALSSEKVLSVSQRGPDPWELPDLAKLGERYTPKFDLSKFRENID